MCCKRFTQLYWTVTLLLHENSLQKRVLDDLV